ncbi:peptidyl-tRNA hydrolase-like protein [Dinothrombium tinctorium]|uniref:Large ribosomal subunit protein mL62 n=1 Tax=Dinothrombium tinctorium TaxID=1965070 RepID=A0A3S3SQN2_9ACAR|nr:peptidyl-tRNA hydrolase-like protein [Dinothrombium tinctorium]
MFRFSLEVTKNLIRSNCSQINCRHYAKNAFESLPEFKSAINLQNVYPKSSLDITKPAEVPKSEAQFTGYIPVEQLLINYARSGAPGGQHANKTNTKVTVSFKLVSAEWIPKSTREKLAVIHRNNITKEGYWIVRSEKTRTQKLNLADCLDKLRCYITEADKPLPKPSFETLEAKRLRLEKAAERRLREKRHRSMIKQMRSLDF